MGPLLGPRYRRPSLGDHQAVAVGIGLRVNVAKCEYAHPEGFVGCALQRGSRSFREMVSSCWVSNRARRLCRALCEHSCGQGRQCRGESLDYLRPAGGNDPSPFLLVLSKFAFSLRSAPPFGVLPAAARFDKLMEEVVLDRFALVMNADQLVQLHLPVGHGGFGLRRAEDMVHAAYLSNVLSSVALVRTLLRNPGLQVSSFPGLQSAFEQVCTQRARIPPFQLGWRSSPQALLSSRGSSIIASSTTFPSSSSTRCVMTGLTHHPTLLARPCARRLWSGKEWATGRTSSRSPAWALSSPGRNTWPCSGGGLACPFSPKAAPALNSGAASPVMSLEITPFAATADPPWWLDTTASTSAGLTRSKAAALRASAKSTPTLLRCGDLPTLSCPCGNMAVPRPMIGWCPTLCRKGP